MQKLYYAYSIVDNFKYRNCCFNNLTITWFVCDRKKSLIPYEIGIKNYDKNDEEIGYSEGALDELFSKKEAMMLKKYLKDNYGVDTKIKEEDLPLDNNLMGFDEIPFGGGVDCILIDENEKYNLPFKVNGYFDIRDITPNHILEKKIIDLKSLIFKNKIDKLKNCYRLGNTLVIGEFDNEEYYWYEIVANRESDYNSRFKMFKNEGKCELVLNLLIVELDSQFSNGEIADKTFEEIYECIDSLPIWNKSEYYIEVEELDDKDDLINSLYNSVSNKKIAKNKAMKILKRNEYIKELHVF